MTDNSGPAFPIPAEPGVMAGANGMSLRDYFAAQALNGLASSPLVVPTSTGLGVLAYRLADALLEARSK